MTVPSQGKRLKVKARVLDEPTDIRRLFIDFMPRRWHKFLRIME